MFKGIIVFFLACIISLTVYATPNAQTDTSLSAGNRSEPRISLITCGPGNDNWESFGHCAIRVVDSSRNPGYRDLTYNYGIFDPFDGSLTEQFLKGRLRVFLAVNSYQSFLQGYIQDGRAVTETVMLLTNAQARKMQAFLDSNALTENKFYTYNIFYDNCATRVRDMLLKTLGPGFKFARVLPMQSHLTFHEVYTSYLGGRYGFELFGNVFYGSKTDVVMSNEDVMFLPDYLEKGLSGATVNGRKIGGDKIIVAKSNLSVLSATNIPLIVLYLLLVVTIAGFVVPRLKVLGRIMSIFLLMLSGFIGIGILYAWFGAGYDLCSNNFNLLWALPTNILLPFLPARIKGKYAAIGISLIGVAFILSLFKVQVMPVLAFIPFWLSLVFVYFNLIKMSNLQYKCNH